MKVTFDIYKVAAEARIIELEAKTVEEASIQVLTMAKEGSIQFSKPKDEFIAFAVKATEIVKGKCRIETPL